MTDFKNIEILDILQERFEENMHRHKDVKWKKVEERLKENQNKIDSLKEMEITGGEPDIVQWGNEPREYVFIDCSKESPSERRSLCYDKEALESRKKNKPSGSANKLAESIGIKLLTEEDYRKLQNVEEFDLKTSSWIKTPKEIRELGGAIFCDRRYNFVFTYHNGADSYYSSRGFRGKLVI